MAPNPSCDNLEIGYKRAFVFLNLAIEQLRQYDPKAAEVINNCAILPMSMTFELAIKEHGLLRLPPNKEALLRSLESLAQRAFDISSQDLGPAPPGLGHEVLREAIPRHLFQFESVRDSLNELTTSSAQRFQNKPFGHFGAIGEQYSTSKSRQELHKGFSGLAPQPQGPNIEALQENRPCSSSPEDVRDNIVSRGRWIDPLKAVAENAQSRSRSRDHGSAYHPLSGEASQFQNKSVKNARLPQNNRTTFSKFCETHVDDHLVNLQQHRAPARKTQIQHKNDGTNQNSHDDPNRDKPQREGIVPLTWAKVAAITTSEDGKSQINAGLGPAATEFSPIPSTQQLLPQWKSPRKHETETEQRRVVWITNIPSSCISKDISAGIVEGAVMSLTLQYHQKPPLNGYSACVIFQHAESAQAFLEAAVQGQTVKYPTVAPNAQFIPGEPFQLDEDLSMMSPPINARRRVKFARARMFYEVSMAAFKRDVLSLCGQTAYLELIHFYNPGECTAVFASVRVASHVLTKFEEWKNDRENETKYSRYKGIEVAFAKDFNEAPATLYTQYGRNGHLAGGRVEGLYSGPVIAEERDAN